MNEETRNINFQIFKWLGWIFFFILLWFHGCEKGVNKTNRTVVVPDIKKEFPVDTIIDHQVIEIPKYYKDNASEKKLNSDLIALNTRIKNYKEEIEWMQEEFNYADSLKKAELYRLATELKKFESNFEDENLKLTINGIIGGNEVKEIKPSYTIKERKIDVPQKQVKFRMLVGGGLGNSITFDKPIFNANVGFQNSKGNILRFGYDSDNRILVNYDFSLFKISK